MSSLASTSIPLHNRIRKRGQPVSGFESESEGSQKRPKSTVNENGAIERLINIINIKKRAFTLKLEPDIFELATKILQDEYEFRLSESHFIQATGLFQSQSNASVFRTLKGRLRDRWLCEKAGVELLDVDYSELLGVDNNELGI